MSEANDTAREVTPLTFAIRCLVNAFCRILKLSKNSYSIFAFIFNRCMGRSP